MSKTPIVEINDEQAAHSILNSVLTQAAVTKKSYKTKFKIAYLDLMRGIGDEDSDTYENVSLQVEVQCKWVESDEIEEDIVIEEADEGGEAYD